MALKASELANAMVVQLPAAWKQVKGEDFPGGSTEDARIMFLAVARGLLAYLEAHQGDMISTINMTIPGATANGPYAVSSVGVDTDLS